MPSLSINQNKIEGDNFRSTIGKEQWILESTLFEKIMILVPWKGVVFDHESIAPRGQGEQPPE